MPTVDPRPDTGAHDLARVDELIDQAFPGVVTRADARIAARELVASVPTDQRYAMIGLVEMSLKAKLDGTLSALLAEVETLRGAR